MDKLQAELAEERRLREEAEHERDLYQAAGRNVRQIEDIIPERTYYPASRAIVNKGFTLTL